MCGSKSARILALTALCLGLAGCGGGGGTDPASPPDQTEPPKPEPPKPEPPQPPSQPRRPQPQPPSQPQPACLVTQDFGCIDPVDYRQRRDSFAQVYRGAEEFGNQWGLEAIRADVAYADIALRYGRDVNPGRGQTVGIIDTGIDQHHPVFAGKTIFEQFLLRATDETGDSRSHGTAVASVIAGNPSSFHASTVQAAQGVARGADLAMFAIPLGSGGSLYRPISLVSLNGQDQPSADLYNTVTGWSNAGRRLDFVNASFGYAGIIEQYSAPDLRSNFGQAISALAQTGGSEKTIFIFAAGNANGKSCDVADFANAPDLCSADHAPPGETRVNARSPDLLAGLPARLPELRGHMVAVVAVAPDTDGDGTHEIASFSNRCGIAAQWCIAAPGEQIRSAYFGPHPDTGTAGTRGVYNSSGTSFAAPMVTGSLVVMKHAFREQLANTDLVTRLLATANNRGPYSDSGIYGRGLLDLGAALTPVGQVSVVLGDHVNTPGVALSETGFQPGGALGNGLARGLSGQELAVFDTLGAPFWLTLDNVIGQAARSSSGPKLRDFMVPGIRSGAVGALQPRIAMLRVEESIGGNGWYLGLLQSPATGSGRGHLTLAGRALTFGMRPSHAFDIAAFSTEGVHGQIPASGTILSWRPQSLPFGFRSGLLEERQTILGSQLAGAFGVASARSLFVGIDWQRQFERWNLRAEAEIGRVDGGVRGGMIEDISPLVSSAFALRAHRPLGDGILLFSLTQPLRVESGKTRLSVPVGRSTDGQVLRRSVSASLTPDGRQIDIAAQWNRSFGKGQNLRLGATWTRHPGHDAAATSDLTILSKWQVRF